MGYTGCKPRFGQWYACWLHRGSNCLQTLTINAAPHNALHCAIITWCQWAATFDVAKRFWTRAWLL